MKTFNLIALSVFIALTVAVLTLNTPTTRMIQGKVMTLFSPFIHASAQVRQTTTASVGIDVDPKELMRTNEHLTRELQKLKIITQRHEELLDENSHLREMLGYKQRARFKNLIAARVIKRSTGTWWSSMILDKGSDEGVATDSPVLTDLGLVGKTSRISAHMSEVVLLTDELCRVAAIIEGTREKGILSGERGALETTPNLRLRFLSRNAELTPGMNVLSSGDGGVFPSKLLLGRVKSFENRDISGEAVVETVVDFSRLENVFVVGAERAEPMTP